MKKRMQTDFEEIKETDTQLPSSRREIGEDMLEQICLIANAGAEITVEKLCDRMDMSKREVTFYLKQLKTHGYVVREKDTCTGLQGRGAESGIFLTELGKITGEEFQYRHEILTQFLQFVGVSEEKAKEDACRMEHVISEETVQQICNFVDYGDTFERILKQSDLRIWYRPGSYQFLMGIYQIEKTCPRRFAREFKHFSENIWLHVTEDESSFELIKREGEASSQNLWYKDPEQGWMQAEERMGNPRIPSGAFKFLTRCQDPIIEGVALIAFTRKGEKPVDWNSRELDVHIWKSEG
ncbi:metal-dependent transcriptional regulator [Blautia sp.]